MFAVWRRMPHRAGDDSGAVAILVAVFGVVMFVLAAFVVDLGLAYSTRVKYQDATDAAALAGAQRLCGGIGATTAATTYAGLNGVTVDPLRMSISTGDVSFITVPAAVSLSTFFGAFVGVSTLAVGTSSTAANDCYGGYAAFAGAIGFEDSGGTLIKGSVYSDAEPMFTANGKAVVTGSIDYFQGDCSTCDQAHLPPGGPHAPLTPIQQVNSRTPACFAYEIGLDRPPASACQPAMSGVGLLQSLPPATLGITDEQCTIDSSWYAMPLHSGTVQLDCGARDVTIKSWDVSKPLVAITTSGRIVIDGNVTVGDASSPVVLRSTTTGTGIESKGNSALNLYGYGYVPDGEIHVGGSHNLAWTGSLIAESIDFNGTGNGGGKAGFLALTHAVVLIH